MVVEVSVNDGDNDLDMEAYESLIRRLLEGECAPAVIHLAMCNRSLGSSERIHAKVCEHDNIPLLSVKPFIEWVDDSAPYFKDGVHPIDPGFQVLANIVTMKLADVEANLSLIPDEELSETNIIPSALDRRAARAVADAVVEAARRTGVARL